jgi:hypothetical protein
MLLFETMVMWAIDVGETVPSRSAHYNEAGHPAQRLQPWIKHSGLYAHAFMFLHARTGDAEWLKWSRGIDALYWNRRNPANNLTLGCIGDPRPSTQDASSQMPELAYWLYKAYQTNKKEWEFRDRALAYMKAYNRYFCDPATRNFLASVGMDGAAKSRQTATMWNIAYGDAGILPNGRITTPSAWPARAAWPNSRPRRRCPRVFRSKGWLSR